jgi:hypothetical protein
MWWSPPLFWKRHDNSSLDFPQELRSTACSTTLFLAPISKSSSNPHYTRGKNISSRYESCLIQQIARWCCIMIYNVGLRQSVDACFCGLCRLLSNKSVLQMVHSYRKGIRALFCKMWRSSLPSHFFGLILTFCTDLFSCFAPGTKATRNEFVPQQKVEISPKIRSMSLQSGN